MASVKGPDLKQNVFIIDDAHEISVDQVVQKLSQLTGQMHRITQDIAVLDPIVPERADACRNIANAAGSIEAAARSLVQDVLNSRPVL
jgi:hypothetical protein